MINFQQSTLAKFIICTLLGAFLPTSSFSDTMDHYMHIVNGIPTMEMKADAQAQAWARSAKNVLIITNESIAETLTEANALAQNQGTPLFCLPENVHLDADTIKPMIQEAYQNMPRAQNDKDKMTVSQVAWFAVTQRYPCHPTNHKALSAVPTMQHEE